MQPSRPLPTPIDRVIESDEVLLLHFIYDETKIIVEAHVWNPLVRLLKTIGNLFDRHISKPSLRYAMLAFAELHLDPTNAENRVERYVRQGLRALHCPGSWDVEDIIGGIILFAFPFIDQFLSEEIAHSFVSQFTRLANERSDGWSLLSKFLSIFLLWFHPERKEYISASASGSACGTILREYYQFLGYNHFKRSHRLLYPQESEYPEFKIARDYSYRKVRNLSRILYFTAEHQLTGRVGWDIVWEPDILSFQSSDESSGFQQFLHGLSHDDPFRTFFRLSFLYCRLVVQLIESTTVVSGYSKPPAMRICHEIGHWLRVRPFSPRDLDHGYKATYVDMVITQILCLVGLQVLPVDKTRGAFLPFTF